MRDDRIPRELEVALRRFEDCFTARSFENFIRLVVGSVLCVGRSTLSRVVMASGSLDARHFSARYRFFSRAVWSPDAVSRVLVRTLVERLGSDIEVAVDDTLRGNSERMRYADFRSRGLPIGSGVVEAAQSPQAREVGRVGPLLERVPAAAEEEGRITQRLR